MGLRGGRSVVECAKVFNLCLHDPILRNQTANLGGRQVAMIILKQDGGKE